VNRAALAKLDAAAKAAPELALATHDGEKPDRLMTPVDWPSLLPLQIETLPEFPVDALPSPLRDWASAASDATQTPPALAASMALAAASTVALGAAKVECAAGWEEELALYVVTVLPSGERKSSVVRMALAPVRTLERELGEHARPRIAESLARREILDARRTRLTRDAGRDTADPAELAEINAQLDALAEPVPPRLLADDATPEALAGLLARHERIGVLAAESALIDNLAGRYSEGKANLHLVCQAYDGEEARIDRRGRPPEIIARPLLALGLAVQPHVLDALRAHPVVREQGLLARMAVLVPESKVGRRDLHPPPIPPPVAKAYESAIRALGTLNQRDRTDTTVRTGSSVGSVAPSGGLQLTLDAEADAALSELRAELEPRLDPATGDLAPIAAWTSKHPGRVARIAGLIHLIDAEPHAPITGATMRAAVRIGGCLLAHARNALLQDGDRRKLDQAASWTAKRGSFTLRDFHRGALHGHGTSNEAYRLVALLEEHGYVRPLPEPSSAPKGGRPPSPSYEVNPALADAELQALIDQESASR